MIFLGADHAGFQLKERVKQLLTERGLAFEDCGTHSADESVDFPEYAFAVAERVGASSLSGGGDMGILACGSGVGMDIAANKVRGVRAALALTEYMSRQSREHDDANVLVLAGRVISEDEAVRITQAFLDAQFFGEEKYVRRVNKIKEYEEKHV